MKVWYGGLSAAAKVAVVVGAVVGAGSVVAGVCYGVHLKNKYDSYNKTKDSLVVEFKKDTTKEYSKEKLDVKKDVIAKTEGKVTNVTPKEIDLEKVGKTEVKVTVEGTDKYNQVVSKTETTKIEVKDTKFPVIELKSEKVEIVKGADINLKENVSSAKDPVDGDLEVEVNGNVNKDQTGEYNVKVTAKDKNKNETSKDYKVVVNEAPAANETVTQVVENGRTVYKTQNGKTYTSVPSSTRVAPSPSAPAVQQGQAVAHAPAPSQGSAPAPVNNRPSAPVGVCNPSGLMALINAHRARNGRSTLAYDSGLASGAQAWSATQSATYGIHGSGYFDEIITVSTGDANTALNNFINSPAHNRIQLKAKNTKIGVGCTVQKVGSFMKAVHVVRFVD